MYDNDGLDKIQKSLDATGVLSDSYKARIMSHAINAVNEGRTGGFKDGKAEGERVRATRAPGPTVPVTPKEEPTTKAVYTDGLQDLLKDGQKAWSLIKMVFKD